MENQITSGIKAAVTISQAELAELVMKTARRLDFELANEPLRMIKWWNSDQQGSVLVKGRYQYQPAVMKLQMVPAITKESWIMRQASKLMSNLGVRPPRLYRVGELGEGRGEVLIMEAVSEMVVPENELARPEQIDQFYKAIKLCRTIYDRPFIKLDHLPQLAAKRLELTFQDWRRARREIKLANELINHEDEVLVDRGIEYLIRAYGQTQVQFCHGHLSCRDVRWTKDKEMAVLSNLYWSYRIPDYDLTFGWHWRRLSLLANPRLGMKAVEVEQPMWQRNMGEVRLARLERALAGLNLDITMVAHLPKAEYELVRQMYRAEILDLMN